jgi:hypothetical protein
MVLGRPRISVIAWQIETGTPYILDGKLTPTHDCLVSQFLMMIYPISSYFSRSHPELYHHLRLWRKFIQHRHSMPYATITTEYRIHQVQNTPSTTIPEYSIHWVLHTLITAYIDWNIDRILCLSNCSGLASRGPGWNKPHGPDSVLKPPRNWTARWQVVSNPKCI